MTDSAPDTPAEGEAQAPAQKRFIFLRKKAVAETPAGSAAAPSATPADTPAAADPVPDERVRPGVLRRRRRQLLSQYEQAIFDLGGLALEMHSRGLLAEDVLRRRAAEVSDLRGQIDELGGRLDEIRQARQERRQAGRGASVACPNCGARSRAGANFCASCGTPLQQPGDVAGVEDTPATEADQPTEVVVAEQVTSVIIEAPGDIGHTQAIPGTEATTPEGDR